MERNPDWKGFLRNKVLYWFNRYSLPRWLVFIVDCTGVFLIFFVAYLLRFNLNFKEIQFESSFYQALIATGIYAIFGLIFHSYSGLIRHTTLTDISLVFIVTSVSAISLLVVTYCARFLNWGETLTIPISIILIHYVTVTVFQFFERILIKLLFSFANSQWRERKNVLIFGAGEMGFIVKRLILSDPNTGFNVAGFLDNNRHLQGKMINNLHVYNPGLLSQKFILDRNISTLIIAIRNLSPARKSDIIKRAVNLGLEVLETPAVDKWLNGELKLNQLRKVKLDDLLSRDPIKLNMELIGKGLNNKVIMVTGAAGSIGSEIVRQLTGFNIRKLILLDQAETPMFHLENELKAGYPKCKIEILLADVTHPVQMERIFQLLHPEIVFHAAAYKHVPMMEDNPHEAIRVNVGGTKLLARLSAKYGVRKFVMISTDKAINPTNVMGASKRICEMTVQLYAQKPGNLTQFIITRFGNVLGSNGSVIPTFAKQIENGGPVTVTHPEISRYFMTIPEACQLVLEAGFMGNGGEIFVFDMGKPVRIADLANEMIRLSGLVPGKDIKIEFTGLRPGEKLHEELITDYETSKTTYNPKIRIAQLKNAVNTELLLRIENLLAVLYTLDKQQVVDYCGELVPEFRSTNGSYKNGNDDPDSSAGVQAGDEKHITRQARDMNPPSH